jgi:hypothetical protein
MKKKISTVEYTRQIAVSMGLGGWVIEESETPAEEGALATIEPTYGQRHAKLSLCKEWETLTPEEQRDTIVHELLHVHLAHFSQLAHDIVESLDEGAAKAARASLALAEEYAVDAMSTAWSPFMPLPGGGV